MLDAIGVEREESLWASIPEEFRLQGPLPLPAPLAEYEIVRKFHEWAAQNADSSRHACFLGGGIYDHFIPAALRAIVSRSEYATAYTPYQPEVAQGTLQAIFEYQSMICELTGMSRTFAVHSRLSAITAILSGPRIFDRNRTDKTG